MPSNIHKICFFLSCLMLTLYPVTAQNVNRGMPENLFSSS